MVLSVSEVQFLHEDIELSVLDADASPTDVLMLVDGVTHRLIASAELPDGDYVAFRVTLDSDASYARTAAGAEYRLDQINSGTFVDTAFTFEAADLLEDGSSLRRLMVLEPRFSIALDDGGLGSLDIQPSIRLVDPDSIGTVSGTVSTSLAESTDCDAAIDTSEHMAIYAFDGTEQTPEDFVAGETGPLAAASVVWSDGAYRFSQSTLEAGSYTLALTCQADSDNPFSDDGDAVRFLAQANVVVLAGESTTVDLY